MSARGLTGDVNVAEAGDAQRKRMFAAHWGRKLARVAAIAVAAVAASISLAATTTISTLIDTDNNAATGCSVSTVNGPFAGVDRVLNTIVTTDAAGYRVTQISLQSCVGGALGPATIIDASSTPIARGNGTNGTTAVETYVPNAFVQSNGQKMRIGVTTLGADGVTGSGALTLNGTGPILVDGPPVLVVPTMAKLSLALTALLLAISVWYARRRGWHGLQLVVVAAFAISMSSQLIAITLDGFIGDWSDIPPAATGGRGNAPACTDIAAVFSTVDNGKVYFRVDCTPNSPPVANAQSVTAIVGQTLPITLTGSDYENSPLTFSIVTPPTQGVLGGSGANVTYTPNPAATTSDSFTFKVNDGSADSAPATVTIGTNRAPAITSANGVTFVPTQANSFTVVASGLPVPTTAVGTCAPALPATITFTANATGGGVIAGSPTPAQAGVYVCPITSVNGVLPNATQSFTLTIGGGPAITSPATLSVPELAAFTHSVTTASVLPITAMALTTGTLPTGANFAYAGSPAATATISGTPAVCIRGSYPVVLSATNSVGTTTQNFNLTVRPVNQAPSFVKGADVTVLEDAVAQTVAGWATARNAGAPCESAQTLSFEITGNTNAALFSAAPAVNGANGDLTFTPAANANGTATITLRIKDNGGVLDGGVDVSATQSFVINVTAVNDAPSFTKGADQTVLQNAPAQTVTNWAAAISAGPADEAAQTLTFTVTNNNNALFSVQPAIAPNGTLTYTPAANTNGIALVTVILKDSGGTANGGVDTAAAQTFNIGVTAVNLVPSFTKGADVTVLEDAAAYSAPWATAISAGSPSEAGQILNFIVNNSNVGLFSVQPAVSPAGVLSFTAAPNANGSAVVSVALHDNGGTASGGVDTSAVQTFNINVTAVNDAPSFTKGANITVLESSGAFAQAVWATALSAGPPDESGQTLSFVIASNTNAALFSVQPAVNATGGLSFTPTPGLSGVATVGVQIKDNGGTANGGVDTSTTQTFTITVTAINHVPSFTKGADQTVLEDVGARTVAGWATGISDGDGNTQTLTFTVTNNTNPTLFSAQPTVAANGTLSFTPAANANGTATITLNLKDSGGTANGGVDTSATQSFVINVTAVNDAPSFTKGADQSVAATVGAVNVLNWATAISAGPPDEAGQTLAFTVTNTNNALFSVQPAVNATTGALTYTVAGTSVGSATVSVTLKDNGGTANGGVDTSALQTFVIAVAAGAPAKLAFVQQPSNAASGAVIAPAMTVQIQDAGGNLVSSSTANVTLAIGTNPGGGTLSGTATVAASGGVATFSGLSIDKTGTGYTLVASSGALTSATSAAFNIAVGAATKLAFLQQPSNATSGAAIAPVITVQIQDAAGNVVNSGANVTLAIGTNPSGGTLSGTATVAASAGVATFSGLSIDKVGTGYTLVSSSPGLTSNTSSGFNITVGAAAKLAFVQQPSNAASGAAIAPTMTVQIQDAAGNLVNSAANVTLAIGTNPGGGTLSGTATVAAVGGVATFSGLSIDKTGAGYTLLASSAALSSATSTLFNITAGAATKLAFVQQPTNSTSGVAIAPAMTVQIQDAAGNLVSSAANVTLAIGVNPSGGALSGTATVAAVGGVATFSSLSIDKLGVGYTLVASSGALTSATSAAFNIAVGAATKLAFVQQPSNATSGVAIAPAITVQIQDAAGNLVNSTANVTLAIGTNPGSGTLSGPATVAAVGGVATFSGLSIDKAGTGYTLVASSGALTGATSTAFNVAAGAAAKLALVQQPTNATSGVAIAPAITAQIQDAAGNLVNSAANVTLAISTNSGGGTLSGTATVAAVGGVATFGGLSIDKAGAGYRLAASSGALTAVTSALFNITPGAATHFSVVAPASATVAVAFNFTATALDAANNVATGYLGTVHFTSSDGSAILPPNYTFTGGDAGVKTSTATLVTSGAQTITATDTITASINGTSGSISVSAGPVVTTNPADTTVIAGQTATFIASATGSPAPTVQWQISTGGPFTDIGGATSTTLSFVTTAVQNGNKYRAVFSNISGPPATTTAATLTVNFAPSVTSNPTSQSVNSGSSVSFSANASGNPTPAVQWQRSIGVGPFSDIAGATSSPLSFTATLAANGNQYRAVFSNGVGSNATTTAATLTVTDTPPTANALSSLPAQAGIKITYPAATLGGSDAQGAVTVATTPNSVCAGCVVTIRADGGFDFTPPPTSAGTANTYGFTYRVVDSASQNSTPATVSFTVAGPTIYFVKSTGSGTSCFLGTECTLTQALTNIGATTNARIFINDTNTHPDSVTLNSGGWLVGLGVTGVTFDALFGIAPTGPGTLATRPTFGSSRPTVQRTVTLNTSSAVRGLDIDTTSTTVTAMTDPAAAIAGVTVSDVSVNTTNVVAVNLNGVGGAISLTSVSASNAASGIVLNATTGSFAVTGTGTATSGGTIQNTTSHGINLTNAQNVSLGRMNIQSTARSGVNGTGVTNFAFTNGTINNSGTAAAAGDYYSNIAFNNNNQPSVLPVVSPGNNLDGTLTVTGSTLSNAYYSGLSVFNDNGTISNAIITGNTITSSTSGAVSKGYGIELVGNGNASTVSNLTRATMSTNTIRNFPSGGGIQVLYGNVNTTGPGGRAGTSGSATDKVVITGNNIAGETAANRMNTDAILFAVSGGNGGSRSQGNADISNNPNLANMTGTALGIGNNGFSTMTATVNNNVIVANNAFGSQGIGGGNGVVNGCALGAGSCETPDLTMTVTNNTVSQTDGNGILLVSRGNLGLAKLGVRNNTVAAPLGGVRPGIRIDAGNVTANSDDVVCLSMSGNTSAGSGGTNGLGIRKQGTVSTIHDFGIVGLGAGTSSGATATAFVTANNSAGNGTLLISGDNFNTCNTAP